MDDWRGEQSRQRTRERRPDLWESYLAAGGWDGTPLPKKPSRHRRKKKAAPAVEPAAAMGEMPLAQASEAGPEGSPETPEKT